MLWPRQEVLQLVLPQLVLGGGKALSNSTVLAVVKQLSRQQSPEGKISFDRWLTVGKILLKWNEYSLQLFWDMLLLALSYTNEEYQKVTHLGGGDLSVDLPSLAIFLVLHANDVSSSKASPASNYDTVWPSEVDVISSSPPPVNMSSVLSPSKTMSSGSNSGLTNARMSQGAPPSSPKSPVASPRGSSHAHAHATTHPSTQHVHNQKPTSSSPNKRVSLISPRQTKSGAHYLCTLRQKLPIILRAITIDDSTLGMESGLTEGGMHSVLSGSNMAALSSSPRDTHSPMGSPPSYGHGLTSSVGTDFLVAKRVVDSLGLIIAGGITRDEQISGGISSLCPFWSHAAGLDGGTVKTTTTSSSAGSSTFSGLAGGSFSPTTEFAEMSTSPTSVLLRGMGVPSERRVEEHTIGWGNSGETLRSGSGGGSTDEVMNDDSALVSYLELSDWLDANLCVNDALYPTFGAQPLSPLFANTPHSVTNLASTSSSSSHPTGGGSHFTFPSPTHEYPSNNEYHPQPTTHPHHTTLPHNTHTPLGLSSPQDLSFSSDVSNISLGGGGSLGGHTKSLIAPSLTLPSSHSNNNLNTSTSMCQLEQQTQPLRRRIPLSSLSRAKPTIINGCSTTVIHIAQTSHTHTLSHRNNAHNQGGGGGGTSNLPSNHSSNENIATPSFMRSVESVDDYDCLALGGMGGMNNGAMGLRKSTASMSSAMSVSSDQMSTGGDLGNESTVEESDGAMSEGGGGSTTPESNGHHHHGAHQLISSSMNRGGSAIGSSNNKTTMAKHELEPHDDSDEVYLDQSTSDEDGDGPLHNSHHTTSGGIMINKLNKLGLGMVEEGVETLDPLRGARASSAGEGGGMTLRHARRRRKVQSAGDIPSHGSSLGGGSLGGGGGLDGLMGIVAARGLPQLTLSGCHGAQTYLLSAYSCASITGCCDCDIVIGAVRGAVIINGCERIRVTAACRKVVVLNSLECEFSIASLSTTVIAGDSRSLVFGPYNTAYTHLKIHLQLAGLSALADRDMPAAGPKTNFWDQLCDLNTVLEAAGSVSSPSGYALDASDFSSALLSSCPSPPLSTASFIAPEKFRYVAVPQPSEHQSYPEGSPILLPTAYRTALENRKDLMGLLSEQLIGARASGGRGGGRGAMGSVPTSMQTHTHTPLVISGSMTTSSSSGSGGGMMLGHGHHSTTDPTTSSPAIEGGLGTGNAFDPSFMPMHRPLSPTRGISDPQKMITAKFTEWLLTTGKVNQVLDLIKLDGVKGAASRTGLGSGVGGGGGPIEKSGNGGGSGVNRSMDACDVVSLSASASDMFM